ncbi:hypothetical protein D3C76_03450 [compost metagenome]
MIRDYVVDYLNAFVVSEQLIDGNVSLDRVAEDNYYLYIDKVANLKVWMQSRFCILYLDLDERETGKLDKRMSRFYKTCTYNKQYRQIYKGNGYKTEVTFEFRLYKKEEVDLVLEIVLKFLRGGKK